MLSFDRVKQEGNKLDKGDVVGGNKYHNDYSKHYHGTQLPTHLSRLASELNKQIEDGDIVDGLVEEYLEHVSTKPATEVIGLSEKLKNAGWEQMYEQGIYFKEAYHKKLLKTTNYKAAQEIHCLLLRKTTSVFLKYIKPILSDEDVTAIDLSRIIDENLVNPIKEELGANVMSLYEDEITGMLYFLTGNCHLSWKKDAGI